MDPEHGTPVVTRGRILAIAALAAFAWLALTLFGTSTPAVADDDSSGGGSLLVALTTEVDEIAPLVLEPLTAAVEQAAEPLDPIVASVAEPVLKNVAEPVVTNVVKPVLGQPMVAETVQFVNDILWNSATSLEPSTPVSDEPTISAATTPFAVAGDQPEPVAVALTSVTSDTRAAAVPATGSHHVPEQPRMPIEPALVPAPSLTQNAGAPTLLAAMPTGPDPLGLVGASAAWENFTPPASPTFDSDTSPG